MARQEDFNRESSRFPHIDVRTDSISQLFATRSHLPREEVTDMGELARLYGVDLAVHYLSGELGSFSPGITSGSVPLWVYPSLWDALQIHCINPDKDRIASYVKRQWQASFKEAPMSMDRIYAQAQLLVRDLSSHKARDTRLLVEELNMARDPMLQLVMRDKLPRAAEIPFRMFIGAHDVLKHIDGNQWHRLDEPLCGAIQKLLPAFGGPYGPGDAENIFIGKQIPLVGALIEYIPLSGMSSDLQYAYISRVLRGLSKIPSWQYGNFVDFLWAPVVAGLLEIDLGDAEVSIADPLESLHTLWAGFPGRPAFFHPEAIEVYGQVPLMVYRSVGKELLKERLRREEKGLFPRDWDKFLYAHQKYGYSREQALESWATMGVEAVLELGINEDIYHFELMKDGIIRYGYQYGLADLATLLVKDPTIPGLKNILTEVLAVGQKKLDASELDSFQASELLAAAIILRGHNILPY